MRTINNRNRANRHLHMVYIYLILTEGLLLKFLYHLSVSAHTRAKVHNLFSLSLTNHNHSVGEHTV
jgi:hypothetical protein